MRFEVLDHTADLRIKIYGDSYKKIFQNAVYAVANVMFDTGNFIPDNIININIKAKGYDNLLIKLISDILYRFETDGIIYFEAVLDVSKTSVKGKLKGTKYNGKDDYEYVLKAPTYYDLNINPESGYAIMVIDV